MSKSNVKQKLQTRIMELDRQYAQGLITDAEYAEAYKGLIEHTRAAILDHSTN